MGYVGLKMTDSLVLAGERAVVSENRSDPNSRLIALPVTRIRATGSHPAKPIFRLGGGPRSSNMGFSHLERLIENHDVVLVGYRPGRLAWEPDVLDWQVT